MPSHLWMVEGISVFWDVGRDFFGGKGRLGRLKEEIFAPVGFAGAQHPHNVAGGVQRERAWLPLQLHLLQFVEEQVRLAPVAAMAAGHQVFPA